MTAPDDILKRAKAWLSHPREAMARDVVVLGPRAMAAPFALLTETVAALESDRALLRRIVEAHYNGTGIAALIDEARARVGEK